MQWNKQSCVLCGDGYGFDSFGFEVGDYGVGLP